MHCERMAVDDFPRLWVVPRDDCGCKCFEEERPVVPPAKAKVVVSVVKARLSTRVTTQEIGSLVQSIN